MEPDTIVGYFVTALFGFAEPEEGDTLVAQQQRSKQIDSLSREPVGIVGYFFAALFGFPSEPQNIVSFDKIRTLPIVMSPKHEKMTDSFAQDSTQLKENATLDKDMDMQTVEERKSDNNLQSHQKSTISALSPRSRRISEQAFLLELESQPAVDIELDEKSRVFGRDAIEKLVPLLPPANQIENWTLLYSSFRDGISMSTLYRKCKAYQGGCIIFIKDSHDDVFGGFTTIIPSVSEHYVGTGQSFLFKCYPDFKAFHWTYSNRFFMKCSEGSLHMGSGEGRYGLWIEESLTYGHSEPCDTYNNEMLSSTADFKILAIEIWGVGTA
eukprot:CFRG7728T1